MYSIGHTHMFENVVDTEGSSTGTVLDVMEVEFENVVDTEGSSTAVAFF